VQSPEIKHTRHATMLADASRATQPNTAQYNKQQQQQLQLQQQEGFNCSSWHTICMLAARQLLRFVINCTTAQQLTSLHLSAHTRVHTQRACFNNSVIALWHCRCFRGSDVPKNSTDMQLLPILSQTSRSTMLQETCMPGVVTSLVHHNEHFL
jgi:hypothetical protein